jgi:hypothetical protein
MLQSIHVGVSLGKDAQKKIMGGIGGSATCSKTTCNNNTRCCPAYNCQIIAMGEIAYLGNCVKN